MKRALLAGCGLLIVVTAGVVRSVAEFAETERRLSVFEPHVPAYLEASTGEAGEDARVHGKVVIVHAEARCVYTWAQGQLPPETAATTPEEVGTVVVLEPEWEHVGFYVNEDTGERMQDASRGHVHATLVEWPSGTVLARVSFVGAQPSARILEGGSGDGGLPMWDVLEWLEGLPRR